MAGERLAGEVILDHYRRPRHRGAPPDADHTATAENPLCGDVITVAVVLDGEIVRDIGFTGRGCTISQASASMMTAAVLGKPVGETEELARRVAAMIRGAAPEHAPEWESPARLDRLGDRGERGDLGDLDALAGVARFPARQRCALLAWTALVAALSPRP